jgi:hypothetical protein
VADLEERVRELMTHSVARDPGVLEASTGGRALSGTQKEVNGVLMAAVQGLREAILEIARDVDELRSRVAGS